MNQKRDNSGALFKNTRKESENHPDYTGQGMIASVDYWLSAWIKEGQKGKFFSLAFKQKDAPKKSEPESKRDSDDVPF